MSLKENIYKVSGTSLTLSKRDVIILIYFLLYDEKISHKMYPLDLKLLILSHS